ncbi:hypothetical protein BASA61_000789 [Batrachochytrium salamandrivorans]|nr:hypothetical protein BASA61_000789 [Batrachochytrium salamandrivorans]
MAPATAESKPPTPTESCGVCTDFKVLRRKRFPMVATTTQSTKNPSTPLAMGVAGVMGTAVLATADSPPTPDLDAVTVPSYSPYALSSRLVRTRRINMDLSTYYGSLLP